LVVNNTTLLMAGGRKCFSAFSLLDILGLLVYNDIRGAYVYY